jgi:hypothetical protein
MAATSRSSVAFAMAISRAKRRARAAPGSTPLSDSADARTNSIRAVASPSAHAVAASLSSQDSSSRGGRPAREAAPVGDGVRCDQLQAMSINHG